MSIFDEPKLSLQDLSTIRGSILLNIERVENEKKKCRSTIDKRNWQSVIDDYRTSYNKIKVLEKSMERRILRNAYNTEVELSGLW